MPLIKAVAHSCLPAVSSLLGDGLEKVCAQGHLPSLGKDSCTVSRGGLPGAQAHWEACWPCAVRGLAPTRRRQAGLTLSSHRRAGHRLHLLRGAYVCLARARDQSRLHRVGVWVCFLLYYCFLGVCQILELALRSWSSSVTCTGASTHQVLWRSAGDAQPGCKEADLHFSPGTVAGRGSGTVGFVWERAVKATAGSE